MLRHSALDILYKVGKYSKHEKHSLEFKEIKNLNLDIYKENFGRIEIKIGIIDWLFLKHSGHRRAKFILLENKVNKQWLAP